MRKITKLMVKAFINNEAFKLDNTDIKRVLDKKSQRVKTKSYLYGNCIAYKWRDDIEQTGEIYISSAGWETSTTRERLNGILSYYECGRVYIKNSNMYYEDSKKIIKHLSNNRFTQIK